MREDFKYPYRIITRKEEIEGNEALGFLFGIVIFLPFMLIVLFYLKCFKEYLVNIYFSCNIYDSSFMIVLFYTFFNILIKGIF
jgi:hypothetical protein